MTCWMCRLARTHVRRSSDSGVWGTILIDVYRESDARALHAALEDLCSPFDNWDFSSAGVYCYWRPSDREPLYIGEQYELAV
jgi:hypothetical protein